jgi:hypothetical protein
LYSGPFDAEMAAGYHRVRARLQTRYVPAGNWFNRDDPMARLATPRSGIQKEVLPPLEAGDHLDQKTFHERHEAMPEGFCAELIGGRVIVPSPLKHRHGRHHALVMGWLTAFEAATAGVEVLDGVTVILGVESEPQPDAIVILSPQAGGQTCLVRG